MTFLCQQLYKCFVTMVTFFVQINRNFCETYDGSNQGYTSVPTDIPSGRTRITFNNNEISHVDDESFNETYIDFSTVQRVYLEHNKIENFSDRALEGFQNLRNIYMKFNRLKHILFKLEDIPRLTYLNLNYNRLAQVPTFYGFFQSLGTLAIGHNSISHVCEEDFENITNIDNIYLARNKLVTFEPRQELPNLSNLDLGRNKLTEIPELKGTYSSLHRISKYDNKITVESLLTLKERINGSEQILTELILGGNEDLSNSLPVVVNFLKQFPKLTTVRFSSSKFHCENLCWMTERG